MSQLLPPLQLSKGLARASVEPAEVLARADLPPMTLGMEGPVGATELGRELLVLGASDRLLDREVGERIQNYWPLRELLVAFNRKFVTTQVPLTLALEACPALAAENGSQVTYRQNEHQLVICYNLLQQMDDYADDLSGSLTEQHLAVLDMLYFIVARELSRLVIEATQRSEAGTKPASAIEPLASSDWEKFQAVSQEAAVEQLMAQLPQRLQLQQQTIILSGTQWLFNQGYPLLKPEDLQRWIGQPMDLENYQTLICSAQRSHPDQFPFLQNELPRDLSLENCSSTNSNGL